MVFVFSVKVLVNKKEVQLTEWYLAGDCGTCPRHCGLLCHLECTKMHHFKSKNPPRGEVDTLTGSHWFQPQIPLCWVVFFAGFCRNVETTMNHARQRTTCTSQVNKLQRNFNNCVQNKAYYSCK